MGETIANLVAHEKATTEARAAIELGWQAVGRLSRIDVIQQQAMANATQRRRSAEVTRAKAALDGFKKVNLAIAPNVVKISRSND